MKRVLLLITVLCLVISSAGCTYSMMVLAFLGMGTVQESDPSAYGNWAEHLSIPTFLPESLEGYTVNAYSYILYDYFDTCYEIFLDLTVTKEQFASLVTRAEDYSDIRVTKTAYYDETYTEVIFSDVYERWETERDDGLEQVGWADVDKIIYNEDTCNIIFVAFHANDTGVHDVENVAYFNRFSITPEEYVRHLSDPKYSQSYETVHTHNFDSPIAKLRLSGGKVS